MDALAEGAWLVAHTEPGRYNHLSASNAVAVALRAVFLFEQADELLAGIKLGDDIDVDLQVVQERALLAAFWGTTLLVFGHDREAGPHLVTTAEQALSMGRIAELAGNSEMTARAEIIEAYALSRLGYAALAAARVKATTQRFRLRDELVETHLARLVLGQAATESGDFVEAAPAAVGRFGERRSCEPRHVGGRCGGGAGRPGRGRARAASGGRPVETSGQREPPAGVDRTRRPIHLAAVAATRCAR